VKSILVSTFVASLLLSSPVFAQKNNFEGFAFEFSTGSQKNSLRNGPIFAEANNSLTTLSVESGSKNTTPAIIGLSYGFKMADKVVATVGLDYNLMSSSIASLCATCDPDNTVTQKISNRANIYVATGYQLSSSSLAYVKIGYGQNSRSISTSDDDPITGGPSNSGWLAGVGYKQFLTNQVYGFAEYSQTQNSSGRYSDGTVYWNSGSLKGKSFLVGVGYKF
jgi:outer membrane immunogenic protein